MADLLVKAKGGIQGSKKPPSSDSLFLHAKCGGMILILDKLKGNSAVAASAPAYGRAFMREPYSYMYLGSRIRAEPLYSEQLTVLECPPTTDTPSETPRLSKCNILVCKQSNETPALGLTATTELEA
jgi:hypothetical protein